MAKKDKKKLLLQTGAHLIHEKGFYNTGIQEILKTAGVPKGSFYFYFSSKQDFGLELVQFFSGFFIEKANQHFSETRHSPLTQLRNLFEDYLEFFTALQFKRGCPIGNLAEELGDINDLFSKELEKVFELMRAKISECLIRAVDEGELPKGSDAHSLADFILNSWEGALVRMKVARSKKPLRLFDTMIFDTLLKAK